MDGTVNVTDAVYLVNLVMGTPLSKGLPITSSDLALADNQLSLIADAPIAGIQLKFTGDFQFLEAGQAAGLRVFLSDDELIALSLDGTDLRGLPLIRLLGESVRVEGLIVDNSGNSLSLKVDNVSFPIIPSDYVLQPAYPNPFNPLTMISFGLPKADVVDLTIYDLQGRPVASLLRQKIMTPGYHSIEWNAADQSSGIYFVRLRSASFQSLQKIMLVK